MACIELYEGVHTASRHCHWCHWLLLAISSVLISVSDSVNCHGILPGTVMAHLHWGIASPTKAPCTSHLGPEIGKWEYFNTVPCKQFRSETGLVQCEQDIAGTDSHLWYKVLNINVETYYYLSKQVVVATCLILDFIQTARDRYQDWDRYWEKVYRSQWEFVLSSVWTHPYNPKPAHFLSVSVSVSGSVNTPFVWESASNQSPYSFGFNYIYLNFSFIQPVIIPVRQNFGELVEGKKVGKIGLHFLAHIKSMGN